MHRTTYNRLLRLLEERISIILRYRDTQCALTLSKQDLKVDQLPVIPRKLFDDLKQKFKNKVSKLEIFYSRTEDTYILDIFWLQPQQEIKKNSGLQKQTIDSHTLSNTIGLL